MNIILILVLCLSPINSLQLTLKQTITCMTFDVQNQNDKLLFTYHHNLNINTAELVVYSPHGQVMLTSEQGTNYLNYMQAVFNKGEHKLCFYKQQDKDLEVHFDIIREQQQVVHAGKEDFNKLTQRIGEFLVQIKKTGWQYKQMLSQHNSRQLKLQQYERSNYLIYAIKVGFMLVILAAQVWAVRVLFD